MSSMLIYNEDVIPREYQDIAKQLFPEKKSGAHNISWSSKSAEEFSNILGSGADFTAILHSEDPERALKRLLAHFRNNVELLIHKTWVEKADETHKERLLDRIPVFVDCVEKADYSQALSMFTVILEELAYLLFGSQVYKSDFLEYTFRIDPQIGLFWWYAAKLSTLKEEKPERIKVILLIGISFLASL
jgi:hypothetical protein